MLNPKEPTLEELQTAEPEDAAAYTYEKYVKLFESKLNGMSKKSIQRLLMNFLRGAFDDKAKGFDEKERAMHKLCMEIEKQKFNMYVTYITQITQEAMMKQEQETKKEEPKNG